MRHLAGALRVVVAFERPDRAWVLLVGVHDDSDPRVNVYALLYQLAGIGTPDQSKRTKPPCCGETTDHPLSFSEDDLDELFDRSGNWTPPRYATPRTRSGPAAAAVHGSHGPPKQIGSHRRYVVLYTREAGTPGTVATTVPQHLGDLRLGTIRAIERDLEPAFGKGWLP